MKRSKLRRIVMSFQGIHNYVFSLLLFMFIFFSSSCCDKNAECTCSTVSGHYSCVCKPGYYGSGLVDGCDCMYLIIIHFIQC